MTDNIVVLEGSYSKVVVNVMALTWELFSPRLASFPGLHASLAIRKAGGRPSRFCHTICATADVTNSINSNSTVPETLQRPDERQVLQHPIQRFETKPLRDTVVIIWKHTLYRSLWAVSHCSGKYNTCISALLQM